MKEDMSQEEVTNVLSGDIYFFNYNHREILTRMKRKRGALSTRGWCAVGSAYCKRRVDLKYATGPHNNHIPGLESTIRLQINDQSQYLTLPQKIEEDMSQEGIVPNIFVDVLKRFILPI